MYKNVVEQIKKIIEEEVGLESEKISEQAELSVLGVTSISMVKIIVSIEEMFSIEFDDLELIKDNSLNTVEKIALSVIDKI